MVAVALAIDVLLIAGLCRILFITIAGRPDFWPVGPPVIPGVKKPLVIQPNCPVKN